MRTRSSVGQSVPLLRGRSSVRFRLGPPVHRQVWAGGATVAQRAFNPLVASSTLARPTSRGSKKRARSSMAEQVALNHEVEGSSPSEPTNFEGEGRSPMVGSRSPTPVMLVRVQPDPPSPLWLMLTEM
jgi:hypothetical protein